MKNNIIHLFLIGMASLFIKALTDGSTESIVFNSDTKSTPASLENLIDSRFKLLATGLQDQIDDLKGKFIVIETTKSEETININKIHHREIQKRETNELPSSKPSCQSGSLFCTFYYPDHPDTNRNRKGNKYSGTVNELIRDPGKVKGIPSSCKDLQLLGHELNGLYLIKRFQPANNQGSNKIETVFCDFQSPSAALNNGVLETRIGVVDVKSSLVHFHVERTTEYGIDGQRIPFEKQHLNLGNGYDWASQWFVAPYQGTYFFSISGSKPGALFKECRASIVVKLNGNSIGEALSSGDTIFGGFAYQFSRKLNAKDKVELVMQFGGKIYLLYFTGWLVDQDL